MLQANHRCNKKRKSK